MRRFVYLALRPRRLWRYWQMWFEIRHLEEVREMLREQNDMIGLPTDDSCVLFVTGEMADLSIRRAWISDPDLEQSTKEMIR